MKIFIGKLIDLLEKEPKDKIIDISLIPDGYKIIGNIESIEEFWQELIVLGVANFVKDQNLDDDQVKTLEEMLKLNSAYPYQ